jgi:hypothetical protein
MRESDTPHRHRGQPAADPETRRHGGDPAPNSRTDPARPGRPARPRPAPDPAAQQGRAHRPGVSVAIPCGTTELCLIRAPRAWQDAAGITEGAMFRRIWTPPRGRDGRNTPCPASAPWPSTPAASGRGDRLSGCAAHLGAEPPSRSFPGSRRRNRTGRRKLDRLPGGVLPAGQVLSRMFRGLFLHYLEKAFAAGELNLFGSYRSLHEPAAFRRYLDAISVLRDIRVLVIPRRHRSRIADRKNAHDGRRSCVASMAREVGL